MEGALCWVRPDEDGYYLVAKNTDGARLMHYAGKPEQLPAGAVVTADIDDQRKGGASASRPLPILQQHKLIDELDAQFLTAAATHDIQAAALALTTEFNERLDCCVHALSFALSISYADAHEALAFAGRRYRCATWCITLRRAFTQLGVAVLEDRKLRGTQAHITDQVRPSGRYIVLTSNHYFAVVDGSVLDTDPNPRRMLRRMWRVLL
jgi:hypothetical protein